MSGEGSDPSVEEFVEYCRTQAGLLLGDVETMRAEAGELLDEVDEEVDALRSHLDDRPDATPGTVSPSLTGDPGGTDADADADLDAIERLDDLQQKQALVEAKRTRIELFQDLASGYADLATELQSGVDDGEEALDRVVRFEADHDAPVYFGDRQTVLEAATGDATDPE